MVLGARRRTALLGGLLLGLSLAAPPAGAELLTPFATSNQSPVAQLFGLPRSTPLPPADSAHRTLQLRIDHSNNFTGHANSREQLLFDGETTRLELVYRQRLSPRWRLALTLPWLWHRGGFLDSTIDDWHRIFGQYQGNRPDAPRNRLLYAYLRDGEEVFRVDTPGDGPGDLRLALAWQRSARSPWALGGSLKLPTGSRGALRGSGSTDLAGWLSWQAQRPTDHWGRLGGWGQAGLLYTGHSPLFAGLQQHWAGFGSLGVGWQPLGRLSLKLQLDGHTALFRHTALRELDTGSVQLVLGGSLRFGARTRLDLALSEDILIDTAPDLSLQLALRQEF